MICGSLVYYHYAYKNSSILTLLSDVFLVLFSSLSILGLLFRHIVPVDPLEWQISQDTTNSIFACLANAVGAAESVLRVVATGHDKWLFLKRTISLSSFGSFDSNSMSLKSVNSVSLVDMASEFEQSGTNQDKQYAEQEPTQPPSPLVHANQHPLFLLSSKRGLEYAQLKWCSAIYIENDTFSRMHGCSMSSL
ncbi:hypothetical protein TEA_025551 [Camellia sinensis var. sinensis]|uniref:Reticulon domain-containing protein n=1 Tax=Camellia sinensis var. sinensis TaxID=542762 RepID=A0A4S4D4L2_CAMSN|nr:hypothetical protein TEA_025551 [Camellia sinensis var. sinensis]